MTDLRRTPSIQHAVALIRDSVAATVLEFEKLDAAKIPFTLNPGRRMFKPLMEGQSVEWAIRQLQLDRREKNRVPNIGLVQAFAPYAKDKAVPWFRECDAVFYPIGGNIVIPVRPSGCWAEKGKLAVLWPQCWKGRTLDATQLAIFNTVLQQTFFVGDFKSARLEWLDMREPMPKAGRGLEILSGEDLGTVTSGDLADYMQILVEAFEKHRSDKATRPAHKGARKRNQGPTLFDQWENPPGK